MQIAEKLKLIRHAKKWSQEEIAHRLNMSPSAYGSIERGETKLSLERLEEIAKVLEIDVIQLLSSTEKNIFNFGGTYSNNCQNWYSNDHLSSKKITELQHELEKSHLLLQMHEQKIYHLQQENEYLKEIIKLFKENQ